MLEEREKVRWKDLAVEWKVLGTITWKRPGKERECLQLASKSCWPLCDDEIGSLLEKSLMPRLH